MNLSRRSEPGQISRKKMTVVGLHDWNSVYSAFECRHLNSSYSRITADWKNVPQTAAKYVTDVLLNGAYPA